VLRGVEEENCEQFERLAAFAVFHGELGAAVGTLQRGSEAIKSELASGKLFSSQQKDQLFNYAEALQLVAMCIAGYSPQNDHQKGSVWRTACEGLLSRSQFAPAPGAAVLRRSMWYIKAACNFLCTIGCADAPFDKILKNERLSLCDRVGFACRFLPRQTLRIFLLNSIRQCLEIGNIEGLYITGLDKNGFSLLQAFIDRFGDVQTAALVSSRLLVPNSWRREQTLCKEWLDSYRDILNTWQMWKSRAMFDVGRADLLRRLVSKQAAAEAVVTSRPAYGMRQQKNGQPANRQAIQRLSSRAATVTPSECANNSSVLGSEGLAIPNLPPQLYARCNFCNTSLPLSKLRRQKGMEKNVWLNREKPVLSCCPSCRKPLPRCAVCLLPMGSLNPYLELKRDRLATSSAQAGAISRSSTVESNVGVVDDALSGLANLPFVEWFTWCMRCKHGKCNSILV
jgi:hypothetical protein